eukprot:maker-scaffold2698_size13172-snap-gene-0.2 protein:Tk03831 transcript:maker-scaffold2698_size13172-snap-gene-0.2-mRNA-1 annotation:"multidrug resistance-associated protein 1 isoform x1"
MGSFEEFCGGPIWDANLTWYTTDPDFTACFHKSVISWTPCFLFLILVPWEARKCFKSVNRNIPWSLFSVSKVVLTLGLLVISVVELIYLFVDSDNVHGVDYLTAAVFILTYLISLLLHFLSMRYGVHTSPAQFILYFFSGIFGAIAFRSLIKRQTDPRYDDNQDTVDRLCITFGLQYACILVLLVLNLFAEKKPNIYDPNLERLEKPCPQITASYFSKLVYIWASPLLWKGYRNPLVPEDLWDVDPKLTSRGVVPKFDYHYKQSIDSAHAKKKKHSIYPALFYTFGPTFFVGSAIKMVYDVLAMVAPQIMSLMIDYVEEFAALNVPAWKGYFYGAVLLIVAMFQTIILSQYFERMFMIGMNLRTAMISVIYRKALRMSGAAKKESTVGEIVNLMSVDVQRFMDLLPYLNLLCPFCTTNTI